MEYLRKPKWLTSNKLGSTNTQHITKFMRELNLHSVCESAQCPNKGECFERGTATFMILGDICTRNCRFCAVNKDKSKMLPPDSNEPKAIAELSKKLNLKYVVITTVTRDDLDDGGAEHFVNVINEIRDTDKDIKVEVLISDLNGDKEAILKIINANPDVFNHNVETIPRLYKEVRPMAIYQRSLDVLKYAREFKPNLLTKSGLMVGLGETKEEIFDVMDDLRKVDVNILTIGQYLQPSKKHYPVKEYVHPSIFEEYRQVAIQKGFLLVESAPLVRSSYHADKAISYLTNTKKGV